MHFKYTRGSHTADRHSPSHTEPSDGEEAVVDEKAQDRHGLSSRVVVVRSLDVQTGKNNEGASHADGGPQHERTTTDTLDDDDGDERGQEVDGTVDTGQDTRELGTDVHGVEDGSEVVGDQVATWVVSVLLPVDTGVTDRARLTGNLLEHLSQDTDEGSSEVLLLAVLEQLLELEVTFSLGDRVYDTVPCLDDLGVIDGLVVQRSEHSEGFLMTTFAGQPTGRFGNAEYDHAEDHDDGEHTLEGDGESPLDGAFSVVEPESDPVRCHDTLYLSATGHQVERDGDVERNCTLTKPIREPDRMTSGPR